MTRLEKISELYAKATTGAWFKHSWAGGVEITTVSGPRRGISICSLIQEKDAELIIALHEAWPAIEKALRAGKKYFDSVEDYFVKHECDMDLYYQDKDDVAVQEEDRRFKEASAAFEEAYKELEK